MLIKIGDFSKLSFVTVKTLHYYDEIGLLEPAKVDETTGYRYYTAEQLPRIQYILALKNMGLSLDDIKMLVNDTLSFDNIKKVFILKRSELQQRVQEEQKRLAQVEKLLYQIEDRGSMPKYQVIVKEVAPKIIAAVRSVLPDFSGMKIAEMFQELIGYIISNEIKPAGPTMLIYNDEDYKEQDADVEVAIQISNMAPDSDIVKVHELPGIEQAASVTYKGPYDDMGEAYNAIMSWIASNGYRIDGLCRELYIVSPGDTNDPSEYVSEIQIPIIGA